MRNLTTLLLTMLLTSSAFGQRSMNDFLNNRCDVVWLGLDFSKARMIGSEGFTDPVKIKDYYLNVWNNLMMTEADKYNWPKALMTSNLIIDYGPVEPRNATVNEKTMVINSSHTISEADVMDAVKKLKPVQKDGIGVVIVIEALDKGQAQGRGHIAFFDLGSKKLLHSQPVSGKASGFGFRNYWASSFHGMMQETQKKVMKDIQGKFK